MTERIVCVCTFKRTAKSEWERGIAIGKDAGDIGIIVDSKSKPVKDLWDYHTWPFEGCFNTSL